MANEDRQPRVSNKIKGWAAGMVTVATLATAILTFGTEVLTFLGPKSPTDPASDPQSTAVQAPPSTPGSSNSVVIFKDRFSKPSGKWPREAFDDGKGFDYA